MPRHEGCVHSGRLVGGEEQPTIVQTAKEVPVAFLDHWSAGAVEIQQAGDGFPGRFAQEAARRLAPLKPALVQVKHRLCKPERGIRPLQGNKSFGWQRRTVHLGRRQRLGKGKPARHVSPLVRQLAKPGDDDSPRAGKPPAFPPRKPGQVHTEVFRRGQRSSRHGRFGRGHEAGNRQHAGAKQGFSVRRDTHQADRVVFPTELTNIQAPDPWKARLRDTCGPAAGITEAVQDLPGTSPVVVADSVSR